MSETEKLLLYGGLAFVAYKVLVPPAPVVIAAPPPRQTPQPTDTQQVLNVAAMYGSDYCIQQGYDPAICKQGANVAIDIVNKLLPWNW
jgi:putative hemolysin